MLRSRLTWFCVLCVLCVLYVPSGFGRIVLTGSKLCHDFQQAEEQYRHDPDGGYAVYYAACLWSRDRDLEANIILDAEIAKNHVSAAFFKALYIFTGGTLDEGQLDENSYYEAFQAYGQVLLFINLNPDYPAGEYLISEPSHHYELRSYHRLVFISYNIFLSGIIGNQNSYDLQSPTYQGERDLELYPQFSPYTLASIKQAIEEAQRCANLPQKSYFDPKLYKKTMSYCRLAQRISQEFLPLEEERLRLLKDIDGNDTDCAKDILECSAYLDLVVNKFNPLIREFNQEGKSIWSQ